MSADAWRQVPRTDTLLADGQLVRVFARLGRPLAKDAVRAVQERARG
jgi:L-seryl-tRNA(Ser) seleniumtransferase